LRPSLQNRSHGAPSPPAVPDTDPQEVVTRALAILAEENVTCAKTRSLGLPQRRQAITDMAGSLELPQLQGAAGGQTGLSDLPLQRRLLSDGTEVPLPIRFFDAQCLLATFVTDPQRASLLLEGTGLVVAPQENGRAMTMVACFAYRSTDIGPYNEVCLGVWALAPGDRIPALYVSDLPVTTTLAHRAGREIWGYNKFVAPIDVQGYGKTFSTTLCDPDNALILTLEGARTASIPTPPADVPTFSMLGGRAIRTVIRPMTPFQLSSGEGFVLKVGRSDHPMAANLRTLALDEARPALVQHADPLQFLLFPGGAL
jgi:acetoacetate decarboxylase